MKLPEMTGIIPVTDLQNRKKYGKETMKKKKIRRVLVTVTLTTALLTAVTGCSMGDENAVIRNKDAGITALTEGNYDEAIADFDEALKNTGLMVTNAAIDINYYKAAAQFLKEDYEGAIETYTALSEYDEKNAAPLFLRGCVRTNAHDHDLAINDFEAAIAIAKDDYELYVEIYNQLMGVGYNDDALTFLNKALDVGGNRAEDYVGRGRVYLLLNQYDAAVEALNQAVEKGSAAAELYLAEAYDRQGEKDKAAEHIENYANSAEVTSASLNALGELQMENKEYAEALTTFQTALGLEEVTNEKELRRNEIAALEYNGQFTDAYLKAREFVFAYPNEQDMQRELTFLLTRFEGPYRNDGTEEATAEGEGTENAAEAEAAAADSGEAAETASGETVTGE